MSIVKIGENEFLDTESYCDRQKRLREEAQAKANDDGKDTGTPVSEEMDILPQKEVKKDAEKKGSKKK